MVSPESRTEIRHPKVVLMLGASGVGKTTIIREIQKQDERFHFVSPVIDRPNRPGETDKVSVSKGVFDYLQDSGSFTLVNTIYGNRYGTPIALIDELLTDRRIPILDFPLAYVHRLNNYRDLLYKIYIIPPTLGTLHKRIQLDDRAINIERYQKGRNEILRLVKAHFKNPDIDDVLINKHIDKSTKRALELIYKAIS